MVKDEMVRAIPVTSLRAHRVVGFRGSPHFVVNQLRDGGEVVGFKRLQPFISSGRFLVLISVRGRVDPRAIPH
jgi:hypothetical protein